MSNKYFSKQTRLISRGIIESPISPPAAFQIAASNNYRAMLPLDVDYINQQAIPNINGIGLFSNFADGLVPNARQMPMQLNYNVHTFNAGTQKAGTLVGSTTSFITITGIGTAFLTDFVNGDYILVQGWRNPLLFTSGHFILKVALVNDDTHLTVYGYNGFAIVNGSTYKKLTRISTVGKLDITEVNTLNEIYPTSSSNFRYAFSTAPALVYYGIEATVYFPNTSGYEYLTKSIDTSYVGDQCYFDYAMDFEYTPA